MTKTFWKGVVLFLLGLGVMVMVGCDTSSSSSDSDADGLDEYFANNPYVSDPRTDPGAATWGDMSVSPSSAEITFAGQTVLFSADGGEGGYTWGVAYSGRGSVSVRGSSQAAYRATTVEANSVIVYDSVGHAAIAQINAETAALAITPASATLTNNNAQVSFKVSGGVAPYAWSMNDAAMGSLTLYGNDTVVYTRLTSGGNVVIVSDASGSTATADVAQP